MSYLAFWPTFSVAGFSSSGFSRAMATSSGIWVQSWASARSSPSAAQWPSGM